MRGLVLLICTNGEADALKLQRALQDNQIAAVLNTALRSASGEGTWSNWYEIWVRPESAKQAKLIRDAR
jgi:hypothetical protein